MRDKIRDMTRSILPSRNREAARSAKARVHRADRRVSREELSAFEGKLDGELVDDCAPRERDDPELRTEIGFVVDMRRSGDKLGPFLRWARARTRTLATPRAKYDRMKRLLAPGTLIKDHALGHFIRPWELNPLPERRRARPPRFWPDLPCLERLLVGCYERRHGELNAFLKGAQRRHVATREDVARLAREAWSQGPASKFARALARFLRR